MEGHPGHQQLMLLTSSHCDQHPDKYSLVTVCEATQAYGLSMVDLMELTGPLKKAGTNFYLRSEVQSVAATQRTGNAESSGDEEGENSEACHSTSWEEKGRKGSAKQSKEEKKAARKANKKQVDYADLVGMG
mmetsp:Transcript_13193/g.37175  ORF Transcript_13193/g.37175 Transcript_13193/m.37175 type:complete len:132 (-) Transcript_13193:437-832(-)